MESSWTMVKPESPELAGRLSLTGLPRKSKLAFLITNHFTLCHNLSKTLHRTQNNSQSSHDGFQAPTLELPTLLLRHLPQLCPYLPHGLAVLQTGQATSILSHCTFFSLPGFSLPGKLFSCISAWLAPQPPQFFALRSPTFSRTSLTTLHKAAMQHSPEHCLLPF